MDPKKVKDILEWPRPVDGKAMQRFLGAANFHRDFSPDFAKVAAPLEECRQEKVIEWTRDIIEAFDQLKKLFGYHIQLQHVCWNDITIIYMDVNLWQG